MHEADIKLIFSPNPNYIHKALVVAHEAGVLDRPGCEPAYPFGDNTPLWAHNPLAKVPCLETDDGEMIYGGLVVCQYLAALAPAKRLMPDDQARWTVQRQMVLGDGLFDVVVDMQLENIRPRETWRRESLQRMRRKIIGAFDQLEQLTQPPGRRPMMRPSPTCFWAGIGDDRMVRGQRESRPKNMLFSFHRI